MPPRKLSPIHPGEVLRISFQHADESLIGIKSDTTMPGSLVI